MVKKIRLAVQASRVEYEDDIARERRGSFDSAISAPPSYHSKEGSPAIDYFFPESSSVARQLRRTKLFISGSVRLTPTNRPALVTSYSDYVTYYVPVVPSSGSPASSSSYSPLRRLFPSSHRRTMSDSGTATMSIVSSQSAPSSLSSGGSYCGSYSSSSFSSSSSSPRRQHRRGSSQAAIDKMGVMRRSDGRPVNALPGELFEQRFAAPFKSRRASSPTVSALTPTSSRSSGEEKPGSRKSPARKKGGNCAQEHDSKHGFGGLRELGKKIRRRVVSRRRNTAEMDSYGAGSY